MSIKIRRKKMDKISEMLSNSGLRKTPQRVSILKVLDKAKKPVSQDQIAKKLRDSAPDKVTIYRCLEKFVETELVHLAYIQDRISYYELSDRCTHKQCHPHFTCVNCGDTCCMANASVPMAKGISKGFRVQRQQVRLEGLCPNCI
jgi:Fur family ferric uptake transcriptional regulator